MGSEKEKGAATKGELHGDRRKPPGGPPGGVAVSRMPTGPDRRS